MEDWTYISVILPLRLDWEPCYRTSEKDVRRGMRVTVIFSGRKYLAVVSGTEVTPEVSPDKVRDIVRIERHLDDITDEELKLWKFIADYYLCTIGEVYKLAYPSMKNAGEQVVARAAERHELMRQKTLGLYRKRLARLQERLRKKEEALAGRHNAKVTESLEADRRKILEEIAEVEKAIAEQESGTSKILPTKPAPEAFSKTDGTPETSPTAAAILNAFSEGKNVLLEGGASRLEAMITVAGKTLEEGRDVLMLVPEILLSKQLRTTLAEAFGDALMVFHSEESAGTRRSIAASLRASDQPPHFILGTRSALFLPFSRLGLIIVEDEHDPAYKQDSAPRYIARDTAVMLGGIHGADVLLTSPTPSLESLYNCISGRYVHIRTEQDDGMMEIVDTTAEKRKGGMVGNLSRVLIRSIREAEGKVLVLRPWGPMDDVEEEVFTVLPELKDEGKITFRTVHEARRMDINGYALLAVIGTDLMLDKVDFRADERTLQVLEQFRGRFSGTMLIQTRQGEHPVFAHDSGYPLQLLAERKAFHYPPYTRMIDIAVHDGNQARLRKLSAALASTLKEFGPNGPFTPVKGKNPETDVAVIRIMLAKDRHLTEKKEKIAGMVGDFEKSYKYTGHIFIDVDPV